MKKIYHAAIMTIVGIMIGGVAMAGNVNIGLGRMDQSDFETLQRMVNGHFRPSGSLTTPIPEATQVAEFKRNVVNDIRQAMTTSSPEPMITALKSKKAVVDIGTGSMKGNEFCALDKMVARNTIGANGSSYHICP